MWGLLDILMTVLAWIYVVCLMLRVQIAEDAMWQLRVAYFRNFVNLKGLLTWDDVSNNIWPYLYFFVLQVNSFVPIVSVYYWKMGH